MMRSGSAVQVKGFGLWLCSAEISVDRRLQVDERMKDTAFEPAAGEFGKEPLDRVEPGRQVG